MAPISAWQVSFAARMADDLDARVVMPDYPLAPEHTWRDSHDDLVDLARRLATGNELVIAGDSAGGGLALAIAESLRDHGGPQPRRLLLISPWVDLTTSTPETAELDAIDSWLFIGKLRAYAGWWAGTPDDLARPEVSPGLADLAGLPPTLMFCGTRDLLVPGCRLLARRAAEAGWDLTYVEEPDLIHVYPILPFIPEAKRAWRRTVDFLSG
jgi:acetyl esterase/lipase